jgi:hypothetical protein
MMPDRIPQRNYATGMMTSKNFWSIGLMALSGCWTNMTEYRIVKIIPISVNVRQSPMMNFNRTINSSEEYFSFQSLFRTSIFLLLLL